MNREDFINAIAENPDDLPSRLMYADWLEERGEIDEALRQRDWIPAKQELMSLMELEESPQPDDNDEWGDYDSSMSFSAFVELLTTHRDEDYIMFGNKESLMDSYHRNPERIWKLWSIITGYRPPMESPYGGCSCCY